MALINHAKREINAKIIYYGCEGAGKRSSLQYIYSRIKPSLRGELKSPSTSNNSLFFFDFSPFENPVFGNYRLRFHVYTLPGKVVNPAAWKMTLKGVDGLVIVADASPALAAANREKISALRDFMAAYGVGLHDIPCVLQLGKAPSTHTLLPAAALAATFDLPEIQAYYAEPVHGEGVLEVLSQLSRLIMARIGRDEALTVKEDDPAASDGGNTINVTEALVSLEETKNELACESIITIKDKPSSPIEEQEDESEQIQVSLAGDCAVCSKGVVRVPLAFTLGGTTRNLVVSIAIDQA